MSHFIFFVSCVKVAALRRDRIGYTADMDVDHDSALVQSHPDAHPAPPPPPQDVDHDSALVQSTPDAPPAPRPSAWRNAITGLAPSWDYHPGPGSTKPNCAWGNCNPRHFH